MAAAEQTWKWPGSKPTPEWQVYTGPATPTHVFYSPEEVRGYLATLDLSKGWDPYTGVQEFHVRIHKVLRHDEPRVTVRTIIPDTDKNPTTEKVKRKKR